MIEVQKNDGEIVYPYSIITGHYYLDNKHVGSQIGFTFRIKEGGKSVLLDHGEPLSVKKRFDKMFSQTKDKELHYITIEMDDVSLIDINKMATTQFFIPEQIKEAINEFHSERGNPNYLL